MLTKRTTRGMRLVVTGFTGPYTLPDDISSKTDHIVHVCAGSGSVPNFSMLKFALAHHPALRHTLRLLEQDVGRTSSSATSSTRLAAAHPGRLAIIHSLTREENPAAFGPSVRKGRIGLPLLREMIPEPTGATSTSAARASRSSTSRRQRKRGPMPQPRFLETVLADLKTLGVPNDRIKREFYG